MEVLGSYRFYSTCIYVFIGDTATALRLRPFFVVVPTPLVEAELVMKLCAACSG